MSYVRRILRTSRTRYAASVLLLAGCRAGDRLGAPLPRVEFDPTPVIAHEVLLERPISAESDGGGFARAADIRFDGDRLVVLENGNSRLVVLDSTFRPIALIGRPGAGPGELRGIYGLAIWNGEYAVTEVNNGRLSVFGADGAFRRIINLGNGFTQVAYGPDGTLYVSAYDRRNYLMAIDREGIARPFAERPWDLYPREVLASPPLLEDPASFAVTDSGTAHVYDAEIGALIKYGPDGRRLMAQRLPARVLDWLTEHSALILSDFGGSAKDARPQVTAFSATDDGRLLLLFPAHDGMFGLLVDASTYRTRPLRWGAGIDPQLAGAGGVVHGGRFYRLGSDEIRVFQLESPDPPER
jgi:hypothetical protein